MSNTQIDPLIPFIVPQKVPDGYSMGRGIIRIVVVAAANANVSIAHNLGRIPNFVLLLDSGTTYAQTKRGGVAWTTNTVSVQFSATGTMTVWIV